MIGDMLLFFAFILFVRRVRRNCRWPNVETKSKLRSGLLCSGRLYRSINLERKRSGLLCSGRLYRSINLERKGCGGR